MTTQLIRLNKLGGNTPENPAEDIAGNHESAESILATLQSMPAEALVGVYCASNPENHGFDPIVFLGKPVKYADAVAKAVEAGHHPIEIPIPIQSRDEILFQTTDGGYIPVAVGLKDSGYDPRTQEVYSARDMQSYWEHDYTKSLPDHLAAQIEEESQKRFLRGSEVVNPRAVSGMDLGLD